MTATDRRFDPQDHAEVERFRLTQAYEQFTARIISDAVFMGSLFALGFRGQNLRTEFSYRWDERYQAEQARAAGASMRELLLRAAPDGLPNSSVTVIVRGRLVRWNSDGSVETLEEAAMTDHLVGRGIVALIQRHEPGAAKLPGDAAARTRVFNDLGDSIGGLLAFALQAGGTDEAMRCALLVLDRMRTAAPEICRKAEAEVARGRRR